MALRAPRSLFLRPTRLRPTLQCQPLRQSLTRHAQTRSASTTSQTTAEAASLVTRLKNLLFGTSIALTFAFGYLYVTDTRSSVHRWLVIPVFRFIYPDAEDAHHAGNRILKALYSFGLNPRERGNPDVAGDLSVEVFGHTLLNPIGTSGGIDKDADIPTPLLELGPAVVEVGGVTPWPQDGNPKPRVFRLPSQNALINRYGLNSEGAEFVAMRLRQRVREFAYSVGIGLDEESERIVLDGEAGVPPGSLTPGKLLAVQVAKNKRTPDEDIEAVKRDYMFCVEHLGKYADIIVVNVSSPNTPGLRSLQKVEPLTRILSGVVEAAGSVQRKKKPAVMVKVSPDEESDEQVSGICQAIWESGVDGVIVGNTTKKRPDPLPKGYVLPTKEAGILLEQGGYSGPQMFDRTLALVKRYRKLLDQGPPNDSAPSSSNRQSADASSNDTGSDKSIIQRVKDKVNPTPDADTDKSIIQRVEDTVKRDVQKLKDGVQQASNAVQPLIRLPERHSTVVPEASDPPRSTATSTASSTPSDKPVLTSDSAISTPTSSMNPFSHKEKVIFATGGITNGKQALEILNAGASVAMVYTALVYGGTGTISRIKQEMRDEISGNKP